jgi:hypothetical protein
VTHHPDDLIPTQQEGNKRPPGSGNFGVHKKVLEFFGLGHTQGLEPVPDPKGAQPQGKLQLVAVHQGGVRGGGGKLLLAGGRAGGPGEGPIQKGAGSGFLILDDRF